MKLREMLDNCFSNMPDQIAWRMATDDGSYETLNYPNYMTKMFPTCNPLYLTDYEVKWWNFDIRNCRLYVDIVGEEENGEEEVEEEEEEDKDNWVIKAKLSNEAGSTTWTKTYTNTAFKRVLGYYNQMIDQLNDGCAFVGFPDDHDNKKDIAMASSQIMYIIIERSKDDT